MYFSCPFVLAILPFTAAIPAQLPLARPSMSQGIAIPIAKHARLPLNDLSLGASEVQNSIAKIESGMAAYERNTGKRHPLSGDVKTLSKRSTSGVPLTNHNFFLWYGNISIGTPPVNFTVNFDTGSSDLLLPSTNCTLSCDGHNKYNSSASTTSHGPGELFNHTFLDGSNISGHQYTDVVTIAGLVARNQTIGAADEYSGTLQDAPSDGLMGLAFQSISRFANGAIPLFQNLISAGAVTSPIFSFKLTPNDSELFLGGFNPDYKEEDFTWLPVSDGDFWQASLNNITITVNGVTTPVVENKKAIFDTGSSQIIGDPKGIQHFYKHIADAKRKPGPDGNYLIPCDFNVSISVYVGEKEVKIPPDSFNLGRNSDSSTKCLAGAAESSGIPGGAWILGDVFLRNVYSAWDMGSKRRIGFADLRGV